MWTNAVGALRRSLRLPQDANIVLWVALRESGAYPFGKLRLGNGELLVAREIFDGGGSRRQFAFAQQDSVACAAAVGKAHLGFRAASLQV